jgi:predicted MPP superfamily phosphohydrolase
LNVSQISARQLRWLHLSDLHFHGDEDWDHRTVIKALLRQAETLKDDGLAPDLVFITGDVAWKGKRGEYEQAQRFLTQLGKVLELDPRESFFIVPGNHDVDRDAIGPMDDTLVAGFKNQEAVERTLGHPKTMELLGQRLVEFYAFTERFLGPARGLHEQRPWRVDERQIRGLDVGVLQLNSAWISGADDTPGLIVGNAQVQSALEEASDAFLRIVLVHHPVADLRDFDRQVLESLLPAPGGAHFLLRGHLHRARVLASHGPGGSYVELAAGTVYTDGNYPRGFYLTELDLDAGEGRVHFYRYSSEGRGFWAKDITAYEEVRDGVWRFPLDDSLRLDSDKPQPTTLTASRSATLTARFRAAVRAVHGTVRFVGYADSKERPNVQVPDLFVPLRLRQRRTAAQESEGNVRTTTQLLAGLAAGSTSTPTRLVVLGDPGSGKTTLCRFAAIVLAGGKGLDDLLIDGEPLPLFVPFRDYVRVCRESRDRDLLTYVYEQTRNQLQLPVPAGFLEKALDEGRAVLLLDGLDEVGSADDREEMRGRVQAFLVQYPRLAAVVTSRVAGYDDAPLPHRAPDGFEHLVLETLDDDDLRQFVSNWYSVQEADDPVARDEGVADLNAALDSNERVKELARNPMLATLIALVHRYEAKLPGERAKLYELCVRTMLETWPAARKRRFVEIDEGLQRAYLEELAYRMQKARNQGDKEVVIEREKLITTLTEVVGERTSTVAPETTSRVVERWVRYLEEGTGLLVEQRPGVFAFFHLSLMEYLAARGMERNESLVDAITEHHTDGQWQEVCLLAVGHRATDKAFLDALFEKLPEKNRRAWTFLLACAREEAAFDEEQMVTIVRACGQLTLDGVGDQGVLEHLKRLSMRHADWTRTFIEQELRTADGEALQAIVLLRWEHQADLDRVQARGQDVAASLLDFWPVSTIGNWAAGIVTAEPAFAWGSQTSGEIVISRSLSALSQKTLPPAASGLAVAAARNAARLTRLAHTQAERLAEEPHPDGSGVPEAVSLEPAAIVLSTTLTSPTASAEDPDWNVADYFSRDFARNFARNFSRDFASNFSRDFVSKSDFAGDFAGEFASAFAGELASAFASAFAGELAGAFAGAFAGYFASDFASDFAIAVCPPNPRGEPAARQRTADVQAFNEMRSSEKEEDAQRLANVVLSRLTGEAWIASMTTSKAEDPNEKKAYFHHRVLNAWLVQTWFAIDDLLGDAPDPDHLALYLTLGWTQSTTTHQWPATDRWVSYFETEAPTHWLPRSQWHLCWLTYDAAAEAHQQGLAEALREGLGDATRPGVASTWQQVLGVLDG